MLRPTDADTVTAFVAAAPDQPAPDTEPAGPFVDMADMTGTIA